MNVTGIVRRVDDLGRVEIPKEVRKTLKIKVGDSLEFFTTREGEIVLKLCQENNRVVDNFMEMFKEMDTTDKKAIMKMLVEEMD
jgi:AbrB family looped-hinge helix DNA binding protein